MQLHPGADPLSQQLAPLPLQEGCFDPAGNYLEYERENEEDAWLDSIEGGWIA